MAVPVVSLLLPVLLRKRVLAAMALPLAVSFHLAPLHKKVLVAMASLPVVPKM